MMNLDTLSAADTDCGDLPFAAAPNPNAWHTERVVIDGTTYLGAAATRMGW